uniref:Uncharacterized protein n=1 Tax=Lotus japonicus TaxID=34305 RepID=I3SDB8_LOTJA|nr:unknown [Lotus japonicus]
MKVKHKQVSMSSSLELVLAPPCSFPLLLMT